MCGNWKDGTGEVGGKWREEIGISAIGRRHQSHIYISFWRPTFPDAAEKTPLRLCNNGEVQAHITGHFPVVWGNI